MDSQDAPRTVVLFQGPIHANTNGFSTVDMLRRVNASPVRRRLYLASVVWSTEDAGQVAAVRALVDEVVTLPPPERKGVGHRNFQRVAVAGALEALAGRGFTHALKMRHDFQVPDALYARIADMADAGYAKVFVTNLFTKREAFHVSDMFLFSTYGNVRAWYEARECYYEDLYSPEVQFARCFVRNRGLEYPFTQEGYLRFLRDWVDLLDWGRSAIVWFKEPDASVARVNAWRNIMRDRDCGAYMCKLLPEDYPQWLRRTRLSLRLIATAQLIRDALTTLVLVELGRFVEDRLGVRPRYFHVKLPGGWILELKLGFGGRRYSTFTVDPDGPEWLKPFEDERDPLPRIRPQAAPAGIRGRRGPFGVSLRRAASDTPTPSPPDDGDGGDGRREAVA